MSTSLPTFDGGEEDNDKEVDNDEDDLRATDGAKDILEEVGSVFDIAPLAIPNIERLLRCAALFSLL
jgi:hypothetical protein